MKRMNLKVLLVLLLVVGFATVALAKDPKAISTPNAPAAVGPYSQAIKYGDLLFISGQLPKYPSGQSGPILTIEDATNRVMLNLQAILNEAGLDFDDVLMTTVYLKENQDGNDSLTFRIFNNTYGSYFGCTFNGTWACPEKSHPPARATIYPANLPGDVRLEVSMVAGK
jgi:2-iminobutanoate/2-iminopropanoate deaminase